MSITHDTDYRASQNLASGLLEQNEYGIGERFTGYAHIGEFKRL
ncbi:MAG: hypothetical protein SVX28_06480 [Pseudomonadota bacterium]|nr:hypothetical protein [Pseudomonadota bacterium]